MIDFNLPITQEAHFTGKESELLVHYNVSNEDLQYEFDNVIFGYISKGKKTINFENNTSFELLPNAIALGSAKMSANVLIQEASVMHPTLCFRLDIAKEKVWKVIEKINEAYSLKDLGNKEQKLPALDVYFGKAGKQIFDTLKAIQHLLIEDVMYKDYWIDLKIEELVLHCLQTDMRQTLIHNYHKNYISDHPLAFAIKYVKENLYNEIEINELANQAYMSKATFYRQFKHHFGMTPIAFIHSEKVKEAQKLLKNTNKSISEIGYVLGYTSPSYFASQFERVIGYSPRDYRKR